MRVTGRASPSVRKPHARILDADLLRLSGSINFVTADTQLPHRELRSNGTPALCAEMLAVGMAVALPWSNPPESVSSLRPRSATLVKVSP